MMPILLVAFALGSTPVFALEPGEQRGFTFRSLDTNLDDFITGDETALSRPVSLNFENMDLNGDGRLSPLEFNNLVLALSVPPNPFPIGSLEDDLPPREDGHIERLER